MKKFLAMLLTGAVSLGVVACGSGSVQETQGEPESTEAPGESEAAPEGAEEIDIAFLCDSFNASWQYIMDQCESWCDKFSEENPQYKVNFSYINADNSVDKQITDMDTAVISGADVIILSAVDNTGLKSAAEAIADNGTIIVDYRGMGSDHENIIFFDGASEEAKGQMAKGWLMEYMEANPDVVLHAGLLAGAATTASCLPRVEIPKELAEEMPDRFYAEVETYSDWTTDNAISIAQDWLQTYPDLNCVVTASEALAQGVVSALNIAGRTDDFVIVTYNGEEPGMVLFQNGEIDCDIATDMKTCTEGLINVSLDAYLNGYRGTYSAGEENLKVITADNYEEWCTELGIQLN